jgi:hypothetical protein
MVEARCRKYSASDLVRMRAAIYRNTYRDPASFGCGGTLSVIDQAAEHQYNTVGRAHITEERLRTYVMAGVSPAEVERAEVVAEKFGGGK